MGSWTQAPTAVALPSQAAARRSGAALWQMQPQNTASAAEPERKPHLAGSQRPRAQGGCARRARAGSAAGGGGGCRPRAPERGSGGEGGGRSEGGECKATIFPTFSDPWLAAHRAAQMSWSLAWCLSAAASPPSRPPGGAPTHHRPCRTRLVPWIGARGGRMPPAERHRCHCCCPPLHLRSYCVAAAAAAAVAAEGQPEARGAGASRPCRRHCCRRWGACCPVAPWRPCPGSCRPFLAQAGQRGRARAPEWPLGPPAPPGRRPGRWAVAALLGQSACMGMACWWGPWGSLCGACMEGGCMGA